MKHICLPQFAILFCSLFILAWVAAGCGEDGQPFGTDAGTDAEIDAGLDAGGDAGGDPETDAGLDGNGDLEIDAGQDANGDQEMDAGQDAGYPNEGESLLVFSPGEEGAWDHRLTGAFSPSCMVKFNGTYFLYYIGASGDRDNSDLNSSGDLNNPDDGPAYRSLGVATSNDGVHFSKYADNPIIEYVAPRDNEEGVFSCAAVVVDNEIQLYYSDIVHIVGSSGGVNANARMRKSSDGFTFTDDTLFMSFSDSTIWGYGDELFPIGVTTDSTGAIQLYYVAKGHGITWGLGLSANGSYEGLINSDTIGGGSVVKVNGKKKLFTLRGSNIVDGWYNVYNKESREILPSGQLGPVSAHTPSATGLFTNDVGPYVVFYDEGLDRWFLYYRSLSSPDSGFYMRTATSPDGDGASEPVQNGCLGAETFSLHDVTYKFPDESEIVDWAETCVLSSVTFSNDILNDIAVIFDYDKRDGTDWFPVDNSVANAWIFFRDENDNFKWHGHTWEWLLIDQTVKYATGIELAATPAQGECIGLMVSGLIRGSAHINVSERSNIVFVEWPW